MTAIKAQATGVGMVKHRDVHIRVRFPKKTARNLRSGPGVARRLSSLRSR